MRKLARLAWLISRYTTAGDGRDFLLAKIDVDPRVKCHRNSFLELIEALPDDADYLRISEILECGSIEALRVMALCEFFNTHIVTTPLDYGYVGEIAQHYAECGMVRMRRIR